MKSIDYKTFRSFFRAFDSKVNAHLKFFIEQTYKSHVQFKAKLQIESNAHFLCV